MKRLVVVLTGLAMVFALAGCALMVPCTSTAERSLELPAGQATTIRIIAGAGNLDVIGLTGISRISTTGTACAANDYDLATIQFVSSTSGSTITLDARTKTDSTSFDVRVEVPEASLKHTESNGISAFRIARSTSA